MPPSSLDYVVGGAAVIALAMVYRQRNPRKPDAPLPPGPPRWPLIGSLLSLPQNEPNWVAFACWGREMDSDVVYLRVMGSDTIVLNSREAAMELLDRRSSIYSDRPWMVMASELVGWGDMLGMCRYGEKARGMRRLLHGTINSKAMEDWWPIQEKEALKFVQKLLREPDNLISHIRHTAGATVAKLTYGYTVQDESDEYVARAERAASSFSASSTPGAFLVDIFPTLKYIPWAPFHRKAAEWRAHMLDLVESPMRLLNEQLNSGTAEPSFVSNWLEESGQAEDRSLIPWAAASLYVGGADTTVSAISTFFLAMLHRPDSQKMAQAEIDQVVGKGRLPNLADRESLPYIEAVYKEVLRWQPLGPIGIPHKLASDTDDNYNGMRIPANSMVIPNIWSMARDPAVYKSPESFNPSRFLGPEGESNPEEVVFGFGRRRCPGVAVAQSSVWLSIALTLAAFDITPETGKDGRPELPSIQYTSGTVSHPYPFRCTIRPRTEQTRRLIEDSLL